MFELKSEGSLSHTTETETHINQMEPWLKS